MTRHVNITDPQIHEPKGVSTASANDVYVADGAGSGEWKPYSGLATFIYEGRYFGNQSPSGIDTERQIAFTDDIVSNSDITVGASGDEITFNKAGTYVVKIHCFFGMLFGSSPSNVVGHFRCLLDGTEIFGTRKSKHLASFWDAGSVQMDFTVNVTAGQVLTSEFLNSGFSGGTPTNNGLLMTHGVFDTGGTEIWSATDVDNGSASITIWNIQ